jgi:eukaryotic-like serine/threonine-protein kinase
LYSVGIVLYEFVTGRRPFLANSEYSIMAAHLNQAPKPPLELNPGLPSALNEIILMAIAKDAAKRFQTAEAFANALSTVPASSAVAPTVPRAPLGAPTGGSTERPAGFWEASPTMERPSGPRTPIPETGGAAATLMGATPMPATIPMASANPLPATTPMAASTPMPATAPMAPAVASTFAQSATPVPAQATPIPMPPPSQGSGHRGLYMTLGALVVLAGLVLAGIYVPRISKTNAKAPDASGVTSTDTTSQNVAQPTEPPASAPTAGATSPNSNAQPAAPVATTASVDNSSPMPAVQAPVTTQAPSEMTPAKPGRPRARKLTAQNNGMASDSAAPAQADSGMAAPGAAADSASLDELETQVDQLSNRAAAINSSLDHLQQQQSAAGFGLRGDMVAKQASMKGNLFKAEEAMQHRDPARTKKYLDLTEHDVDALERFLGH